MLPWQPKGKLGSKVVAMVTYSIEIYVIVQASLTVPLYLYFAEVKPTQNIDILMAHFNCYIVHCHGNHFLNPEKWGSKSGCHGNVL